MAICRKVDGASICDVETLRFESSLTTGNVSVAGRLHVASVAKIHTSINESQCFSNQ